MQPSLCVHLAEQLQRRTLVSALRSRPDWTLQQLTDFLDSDSPRARELGCVRVEELLGRPVRVDIGRRREAEAAKGVEFDRLALAVLIEVWPRGIGAGYLSARLGGPRWKLQASMHRLAATGYVIRVGRTFGTRYRAVLEL